MAEVTKEQEVLNFVKKKGPEYAFNSATEEEKRYFEGIIYENGIPNLSLISYLCSPVNFY